MSYFKSYRMFMLLLIAVSLILVPGFTNDAYAKKKKKCKNPDPVMISLQDLDDWINTGLALEADGKDFSKGYNNGEKDSCGYKKMSIVSIQKGTAYAAGHPIGAYLWDLDTELRVHRSDGVLQSKKNHSTAEMTDVIVQRAGIKKKTVIVLTGDDLRQIGIAYSQLRYWGFPKAQLRVANGVLADYPGVITTDVPAPVGNDYSVCKQEKKFKIDETRASLEEMMSVATDTDANTVVFDVRSSSEYNGTKVRTDTAFSGRIATAVFNEWKNQTTNGGAGAGNQIKSYDDLYALVTGEIVDPIGDVVPMTGDETFYIY